MPRPRLAPALLVLGGGLVVAGSLLPWATARIDLSVYFELLPPDYRHVLRGPELGGGATVAFGAAVAACGAVATAVPRIGPAAGGAGVVGALGALMVGLFHLIRMRVIALDALARAAERDPRVLRGASASPDIGTFVVIAGAGIALVGAAILLARWGEPEGGMASAVERSREPAGGAAV